MPSSYYYHCQQSINVPSFWYQCATNAPSIWYESAINDLWIRYQYAIDKQWSQCDMRSACYPCVVINTSSPSTCYQHNIMVWPCCIVVLSTRPDYAINMLSMCCQRLEYCCRTTYSVNPEIPFLAWLGFARVKFVGLLGNWDALLQTAILY